MKLVNVSVCTLCDRRSKIGVAQGYKNFGSHLNHVLKPLQVNGALIAGQEYPILSTCVQIHNVCVWLSLTGTCCWQQNVICHVPLLQLAMGQKKQSQLVKFAQ